MPVQYAGGTIVNTTFTGSTGTRLELANWVSNSLITAGWSQSGSSGDYFNVSATTPQGFSIRIECKDPGSGNCAQFKMSLPDTTRAQIGAMYILPNTSRQWRIIANKYQFFVFALGAPQGRDFICGGVPYSPLSNLPINLGWAHGNAFSDTDSLRSSFRSYIEPDTPGSPGIGSSYQVFNGIFWETTSSSWNNSGYQKLLTYSAASGSSVVRRWYDNTNLIYEPYISWGATAAADEGMIRGQLWDSIIMSDQYISDSLITWDSRQYYGITNMGSASTFCGTLFVAIQ